MIKAVALSHPHLKRSRLASAFTTVLLIMAQGTFTRSNIAWVSLKWSWRRVPWYLRKAG